MSTRVYARIVLLKCRRCFLRIVEKYTLPPAGFKDTLIERRRASRHAFTWNFTAFAPVARRDPLREEGISR